MGMNLKIGNLKHHVFDKVTLHAICIYSVLLRILSYGTVHYVLMIQNAIFATSITFSVTAQSHY